MGVAGSDAMTSTEGGGAKSLDWQNLDWDYSEVSVVELFIEIILPSIQTVKNNLMKLKTLAKTIAIYKFGKKNNYVGHCDVCACVTHQHAKVHIVGSCQIWWTKTELNAFANPRRWMQRIKPVTWHWPCTKCCQILMKSGKLFFFKLKRSETHLINIESEYNTYTITGTCVHKTHERVNIRHI